MTALKPIENRNVRGVASETYPSNRMCAHPECTEKVTLRPSGEPTVHHIFPRGQIKGKSYFVEVTEKSTTEVGDDISYVLPHAVGLCGSGTTGHHGDVEEHRAWIKLEDGVYVWYDRGLVAAPSIQSGDDSPQEMATEGWLKLGPLNPQPGSREGKAKRRKFQGEAKRKRVNWQVKVPADQEDGAGILDEGFQDAWEVVCKAEEADADQGTAYTRLAAIFEWVRQQA